MMQIEAIMVIIKLSCEDTIKGSTSAMKNRTAIVARILFGGNSFWEGFSQKKEIPK
jgi:hypothetical protein